MAIPNKSQTPRRRKKLSPPAPERRLREENCVLQERLRNLHAQLSVCERNLAAMTLDRDAKEQRHADATSRLTAAWMDKLEDAQQRIDGLVRALARAEAR